MSSRVYKARSTACLTYFPLRRTSVICVLEDIVTFFPYVSTVFVKTLVFPDAYFIFCNYSFLGVFSFFSFFNICVCVVFTNKEISHSMCLCLSVCLSVRPSQAGIVWKRMNGSNSFFAEKLPSVYRSHIVLEENLGIYIIRVLTSVTFYPKL